LQIVSPLLILADFKPRKAWQAWMGAVMVEDHQLNTPNHRLIFDSEEKRKRK